MFQMIDEATASPEDRKMTMVKIGAFILALAILGGVVYFFAFVSYANY